MYICTFALECVCGHCRTGEKEGGRTREIERQRERESENKRECARKRERGRNRDKEREREKERDRQTDTENERGRQGTIESECARERGSERRGETAPTDDPRSPESCACAFSSAAEADFNASMCRPPP